jgi:DNA polymerase III subunit gamma/tau
MQKQQESEQQNAVVDLNSLPKNPFTIDEFVAKWNRYCYELKEQGKDTLYSAMTKRTPTLGSNYEILLHIDNKVQEEYINNIKLELLDFLRKELNNYSISLELLVEKDTTEKIAYTGKEKFDKMAQTNPNLIKLQHALKLIIN